MNHYPFNPSDYMMATAHLDPLHDLCYRRCLDLYYDTETPLQANAKQSLSKRLRVNEDVLSEVLAEFFEEHEDGWHHKRCDAEIARYRAKSEKAKKAGSLGGMAKKPPLQANAKRTLSERQANASNQNQNQNHSTTAKAVGRIASHSLQLPDSDWLKSFESDPAYTGLNIAVEFGKMSRWCETNGKLPSRKRFVNWLNRAEKPMAGVRTGKHAAYDSSTATTGLTPDQIGKF